MESTAATLPLKKFLVGCFKTFSGRPEDWTISSSCHLYDKHIDLLFVTWNQRPIK